MNIFSRPPYRPYRNIFLAALIGVPVGCLMVSLHLALFDSTSPSQSLTLIADALPTAFIGYLMMAPLLLVYGLPALWLALKLGLAGPATAFVVSLAPALAIWLSTGSNDSLVWLPLAISAATGLAFVTLAYRGADRSSGMGRVDSQTTADNGDRHGKA